jgi:hypothetical protein
MRKALSISLILAVALAGSAFAKPVEYNVRSLDQTSSDIIGKTQGVFSSAIGGTTFFGGTYWNGTTSRWEALADSVWTFDTGVGSDFDYSDPEVDPFKSGTGRHAHMEGWVGRDDTYGGDNPYFRRISTAADGGVGGAFAWKNGVDICVGTSIGLSGTHSWWAGRSQGEVLAATLDCWFGGQGYGNSWAVYIEKSFPGVAAGNDATLSFNANVESEDDFDYAYAFVDTGDGEFQEVWSADGPLGVVSPSINLAQGTLWPETSQDVVIRLGFESDGAWSDEDGLNPTTCGGVSFDDVALTGDVTYGPENFDASADGWAKIVSPPGEGDWSDLRALGDVPTLNTSCDCDLQDTVLVAYDPVGADAHPLDMETMVMSPWIDISAAGLTGSPVKFFQYSTYADTPLINFVFRFHQMKWFPVYCAGTGLNVESGWNSDGYVYYGDPFCDQVGQIPTRLDYSDVADPGAQKLRIAIGVLNLCSGWAACTGFTNFSPIFDNVSVGIGGLPTAPFVTTSIVDTPYDSFPESGTLRPDAPGRVDCNQANDENLPFSSVGDTLIALGGGGAWGPYGGVIMEVLYFVSPGPGINGAALAAWNALHQNEGAPLSGFGNASTWYSARMDTAETNNAAGAPSTWMTAYHEDDPNGPAANADTLKDSGDLNPYGLQTRLQYDIFPDDLFTPGTHIGFAYRTSYVDTNTGLTTGTYFYYPAGFLTNGDYMEMEVLPSSMATDSTWNCVLYVNHADDRGAGFEGSTALVEDALDAVISGSSGNYDGTPYDIFDVEAPSSNQGSFGRPIGSEYGCAATQVVAYNHIIWYSRSLSATSMKEPDADVLAAWLTSLNNEVKDNRFYGTGDGLADAMDQSTSGSVQTLLGSLFGTSLTCNSYRAAGCNATGFASAVNCLKLDPVGTGSGAHFDASTLPVAVIGSGCPAERDYDVMTPSGAALDDAQANEFYRDGTGGLDVATNYSSVSHDVNTLSGIKYRSVLDGVRIDNRRDNATCGDGTLDTNDTDTITDRMSTVGTWLGFAGAGVSCNNPYEGLDVGPQNPTFVTALRAARPNPFTGKGVVNLEFSMELKGQAKLEVFDVNGRLVNTIFDGVAEAGPNVVEWDAKDQGGNSLASGVYFYRLSANGQELAKKQVVVRSGN